MSQKNVKIAVLGFSTTLMGATIITGIVADIAKAFPDAGSKINLVLTLPFLVATLCALLAGPLSKFIAKKTIVIISHFAILAGCGVAYLFGEMSINMLMLASILLGVSQGALSTLSMALIADYFDGHERGALMGLQSTFVTFGGMIITFIGAMLAGIYWKNTYLVLLVALPSLFLSMKFLPKDQPAVAEAAAETGGGGGITGAALFYVLAGSLYGLFMFVFQANVAFYITGNGLGDAATAGYAASILVAAGGVTGIFYGKLSQILKRLVMPIGLFVTVIGFLLIIFVGNLPSVFIAAALIGYGLTSTVPTIMYNASVVVPPSSATMAIALINTGCNVGMFVSPFVLGFVMKSIGKEGPISQFIAGAIGLTVVATLYIIVDGMIARNTANQAPAMPAVDEA